jgi:LPXTG-motif cell wall-anchored protein
LVIRIDKAWDGASMDALSTLSAGEFLQHSSIVDVAMAVINAVVLILVLPWIVWGLWVARPYCVLIGGIGTIVAGLFIADRETRAPWLLTGGVLVLVGGAWIVRRRRGRSRAEDPGDADVEA